MAETNYLEIINSKLKPMKSYSGTREAMYDIKKRPIAK